jgi:hypothetical protein
MRGPYRSARPGVAGVHNEQDLALWLFAAEHRSLLLPEWG